MLKAKRAAKYVLAPLLYRFPPTTLLPERLGIYLINLLSRANVRGDIAEIGCNLGGTAVMASSIVRRHSPEKTYFCFDTFDGFVDDQFDRDTSISKWLTIRHKRMFSSNSINLVRYILNRHGARDVRLIKCDITELDEKDLRSQYSVVLIDVDLSEPTYIALNKFFPRLASGGVIMVDDCDLREEAWTAGIGYKQFCSEQKIDERLEYGLGIIEKP